MKIKKYRKRPVVIEAIEWDGTSERASFLSNWTNLELRIVGTSQLVIPTSEGDLCANIGDIVIKGIAGEFYPCQPDIFEKTYEEVPDG